MRRFTTILARAIALLAAVNAAVLALAGTYDLHAGPLHLVARSLFKPLLYLGGADLLAMLLRSSWTEEGTDAVPSWSPPVWLTAAAVMLLYLPAFGLNPPDPLNDWLHRADTEGIRNPLDLLRFFTWRQPDGFYRPLTFVSFWLDRVVLGNIDWAYHVQNILLHTLNAMLVVRLGLRLKLDSGAARWAGLLFGVAAIAYEPVIWPGARFDLLAGFFVLLALLAALEYLEQDRLWTGSLARLIGFFLLGVFSKESAYCVPVLFAFLCWTRSKVWRNLPALAMIGAATFAMLAIRFAIFHGMGGYPQQGGAPHFAVGVTTFTSFFTRALPAPLLLLNTDVALTVLARISALLFAAWVAMQGFTSGGSLRRHGILLAAALISALPAVNLVNWIGPIAQNVRYVYLTSIWVFFLAASAAWANRYARRALALLAIANLLGVVHNTQSFKWQPGLFAPPTAAIRPGTDAGPR